MQFSNPKFICNNPQKTIETMRGYVIDALFGHKEVAPLQYELWWMVEDGEPIVVDYGTLMEIDATCEQFNDGFGLFW